MAGQSDRDRRPPADRYDEDLARDNTGARDAASGAGVEQAHVEGGEEHRQHARKGQAQSPRELTLNQPEKKKEGHH